MLLLTLFIFDLFRCSLKWMKHQNCEPLDMCYPLAFIIDIIIYTGNLQCLLGFNNEMISTSILCRLAAPIIAWPIFKLSQKYIAKRNHQICLTLALYACIIGCLIVSLLAFREDVTENAQHNIPYYKEISTNNDKFKQINTRVISKKQAPAETTIESQQYESKLVSTMPTFTTETDAKNYIDEHLNELKFNFTIKYSVYSYAVYDPETNLTSNSIKREFTNLTYTEFLNQYKNLENQQIKGTTTETTFQLNSWLMSHPITYTAKTSPILTMESLPKGEDFKTPIQVEDSVSPQLINRFENGELTSKTVKIPIQFTYQP